MTTVTRFFSSVIRSRSSTSRWGPGPTWARPSRAPRVHGEGASDAQALLLATGEVGRRDFQSALHAVQRAADLSDVSAASSRIDFFFTPLKRSPETAFS